MDNTDRIREILKARMVTVGPNNIHARTGFLYDYDVDRLAKKLSDLLEPAPEPDWIDRPDSPGNWWQSCKVPTGYISPEMIWVWKRHDDELVCSESGHEYTMDEYLTDYYPGAKFLKVVFHNWQSLNTPAAPDTDIDKLAKDLEYPRLHILLAEWVAIDHDKTRAEYEQYLEAAGELIDYLSVIGVPIPRFYTPDTPMVIPTSFPITDTGTHKCDKQPGGGTVILKTDCGWYFTHKNAAWFIEYCPFCGHRLDEHEPQAIRK